MGKVKLGKRELPIATQNLPNAKSLSVGEIRTVIKKFGDMAERARNAGFDGVEVNAGSPVISWMLLRTVHAWPE